MTDTPSSLPSSLPPFLPCFLPSPSILFSECTSGYHSGLSVNCVSLLSGMVLFGHCGVSWPYTGGIALDWSAGLFWLGAVQSEASSHVSECSVSSLSGVLTEAMTFVCVCLLMRFQVVHRCRPDFWHTAGTTSVCCIAIVARDCGWARKHKPTRVTACVVV